MDTSSPRVYRKLPARSRDSQEIAKADIKEVASLKLAAVDGGDARRAKPSFRKQMGEYLTRARLASGSTQAVAAAAVGLSLNWYGAIERGDANVTMENLEAIADMLKIDLFELFSREPNINDVRSEPITEGVRRELLQNAEIVAARADEMTRWLKAIAPHERRTPSRQ